MRIWYSYIGVSKYHYTEDEVKKEIENGDFERLGKLSNIKIECLKSNYYSISIIYFIFALICYFFWFS